MMRLRDSTNEMAAVHGAIPYVECLYFFFVLFFVFKAQKLMSFCITLISNIGSG